MKAERTGGSSAARASKVQAGRLGGAAASGDVKRAAQEKGLRVRRRLKKNKISLHLRRRPLECIKKLRPADKPVFLDLFSGKGGLSKAVESFGGYSLQWDIKRGEAYDLTAKKNARKIIDWMRGGKIWGTHLAMLCKSWSMARRGGTAPPLRSKKRPWGLPGLSAEDKEKARIGNVLLEHSLTIMRVAKELGMPFAFENPHSSRLPPRNIRGRLFFTLFESQVLPSRSDAEIPEAS